MKTGTYGERRAQHAGRSSARGAGQESGAGADPDYSRAALREAKDRQIEGDFQATEPAHYGSGRAGGVPAGEAQGIEDAIRYERTRMGTGQYAHFEEQQGDQRARSVFERALDITYTDKNLWLKYAEMEMRNKFVNHARNVWDRAVSLLPRVDQFWFKYSYMEEMLGNTERARQVFERWMQWEPDDQAWNSYVKFEVRAGDMPRARVVHERYLGVHQTLRAFLKVAKWEARQGDPSRSRAVFERAVDELPDEDKTAPLFAAFAQFEERVARTRARAIYRFALDRLPEEEAAGLKADLVRFEKQHGDSRASRRSFWISGGKSTASSWSRHRRTTTRGRFSAARGERRRSSYS